MRLPPDCPIRRSRAPDDAGRAGRGRGPAAAAGDVPELVDTAVLLASELCENAVLHAGTEFDLAVTVDRRPRSPWPSPTAARVRWSCTWPSRAAATGGRPPTAAVWPWCSGWPRPGAPGTRPTAGTSIWFSLARRPGPAADTGRPPRRPNTERVWTTAEQARWLLHVPAPWSTGCDPVELVAELVRRLRELLDAEAVSVEVDEGDGAGPRARPRRRSAARHRRRARAASLDVPAADDHAACAAPCGSCLRDGRRTPRVPGT